MPYLKPYLNDVRILNKQYRIQRKDDVKFAVGDSTFSSKERPISLKNTRKLWVLLSRKNVNWCVVTTEDLKRYDTILESTNAHLKGYEPG